MPLPAQHTKETNIQALSWIRTRDPSNREAADLALDLTATEIWKFYYFFIQTLVSSSFTQQY
jgi:hypothetical protein